jgi:hypothetical protein
MISYRINRSDPLPSMLVVQKGSKIWARYSRAIP